MTSTTANEVELNYKIVIVGESSVGKTNILSKFVNNKFFIAQNATIGIEFTSKIMRIENRDIKVQMWDTAGQQRYRALASVFYKNAVGAMVVFDITNKISFDNTKKWIQEIQQQSTYGIDIILIGNKSDLFNRQVQTEDAQAFAEGLDLKYIETSAAEGTNIKEAFEALVQIIYSNQMKIQPKEVEVKKPIMLDKDVINEEQKRKNKKNQRECCK